MKHFSYILLPLALMFCLIIGCANLGNPSSSQKVNNNGQIDEIKNNQDGINLELGKVRQNQSVTAQKVDTLQQGLVNQSNAGIQILQGSGGLVLVFGLATVFMILHYRNRAVKGEQVSEIMAKEIAHHKSPELNKSLMKAAENTLVEDRVHRLIRKHQPN